MDPILTPEKFAAKASLILILAIEANSPRGLAIPVTLNHRLYKNAMTDYRNIDKSIKKGKLDRRPITDMIPCTFRNPPSGWSLTIGEGKNTLLLTEANVDTFRKWLKCGNKPSTMAQWRLTFGS